jgi:hypothetical protein
MPEGRKEGGKEGRKECQELKEGRLGRKVREEGQGKKGVLFGCPALLRKAPLHALFVAAEGVVLVPSASPAF